MSAQHPERNIQGKMVSKFSKSFAVETGKMKQKRYELRSATVNFILYWKKEEMEQEVKVVLPQLCFERTIEG